MRWAALCGLVSACTAAGPKASGPPGDVRAIVSRDDARTGTALAVSDPDGVRTITDDARGTITFRVTPPASVTWEIAGANYYATYTGVEPGDVLCFICPDQPATVATTTVAAPALAGAARYSFGDGDEIHYDAPAPQVDLRTEAAGPHDVLVVASDDAGAPLAWNAALGQILDGGTLSLPGAWRAVDTFTATFDGLPAMPVELHVQRAEMSNASGRPPYAFFPTVVTTTGGPHADVAVPTADFGGPTMIVLAQLWASGHDQIDAWSEVVPSATSVHVDAATALLPWITDVAYDAGSRTVTWQHTPGDVSIADGLTVRLSWIDAAGVTGTWTLVAAPDATEVTFPALPDDPALPAVTSATVELDDFRDVTSYAQRRSSTTAGDATRLRMTSGTGRF